MAKPPKTFVRDWSQAIAGLKLSSAVSSRPSSSVLSDEDYCAAEHALQALEAIANRSRLVGDVLEPVADIRAASKLAREAAARLAPLVTSQDAVHEDDLAIDRFCAAMKAKMARSRAKGRGGWNDPAQVSDETLATMLVDHLRKGNAGSFEDVANFAMMLHQREANPAVLVQALLCAGSPGSDLEGQAEKLKSAQDLAARFGNALIEIAQLVGAGKAISLEDDLPRLVRERLDRLAQAESAGGLPGA